MKNEVAGTFYIYTECRSMKPIYLDYHATTPVAPEVLEEMLPWFSENFGNAASRSHPYGWKADEAVQVAREKVAKVLGVSAGELFFTSGATEGLNMAIKGLAEASGAKGRHLVTISTEHKAVLDSVVWLSKKGFEVTILPVGPDGMLDLDILQNSLRTDTIMAVVMWGNNETGVLHPIAEIGQICRNMKIPLICDATQALGKIHIRDVERHVDILCFSGHKVYGPKGVGGVYINKNLKPIPAPLIHGGGHERGHRSGTLNVPGIVGLGASATLCRERLLPNASHIASLRDHLESTVLSRLEDVKVNGQTNHRLPTVTNLTVAGVESQAVMSRFRAQLSISTGSACSSADPAPSHVLQAMGLSKEEAKSSFRFSLGWPTTRDEIDLAAEIFIKAVNEERSISPSWLLMKG